MLKRIAFLLLLVLLSSLPAHAQYYERPGQLSLSFNCAITGIAATLTEITGCSVANIGTKSYYITDIVVQSTTATANQFSVQSGTGTNCATNTQPVFPSDSVSSKFRGTPTSAATGTMSFTTPIKVTAGQAICVLGVATDTTSIYLSGFKY